MFREYVLSLVNGYQSEYMDNSEKIHGPSFYYHKQGADRYTKTSYPLRYGRYSELQSSKYIFHFNLNGELIFVRGKDKSWPSPQEWLKRSSGNDWVYYSTGGYTGVFEAIGEFYLPNLQYPTNSLIGGKPFTFAPVKHITEKWYELLTDAIHSVNTTSSAEEDELQKILTFTPAVLEKRAQNLFSITGGRTTVLPPDARHVDYDVIPLTISTGCLYKCRFCKVKNLEPFKEKSKEEIDLQISRLKDHYADNLINHNSVFLGEHDCLNASAELILYAVRKSYELFNFSYSNMRGANYFLFGSVDSLLEADQKLFDELKTLPCDFYINIGLESADQATLDRLGKPIKESRVKEAFAKIQEINDHFLNIEITANFLMDEDLPDTHYPHFLALVRDSMTRKKPKGCIYLSPLTFANPSRHLVLEFSRLKLLSRLPTYLYIIQRL